MPLHNLIENERDMAYQLTDMDPLMVQHALAQQGQVMLDPISVTGRAPQPQSALPRTMAQYQPMQRPQAPQGRSPQAQRTDEQLGLALMLSGDDKLSGVGQTLFPKTLGAGDQYKEQMADIRHQEQMQQRYAAMQNRAPLVQIGGETPAWKPLGSTGQFYRPGPDGMPQVMSAPGSPARAEIGEKLSTAQGAMDTVRQNIGVIDAMLTHPGRAAATGRSRMLMQHVPYGETRDFMAYEDQILGAAFLQAFETLKGGGQITEIEGRKATEAITRLQKGGMSEEGYERALRDLRDVMTAGLARAQREQSIYQQQLQEQGMSVPFQQGGPPPLEVNVNAGQEVWTKDANGQWVRGQ